MKYDVSALIFECQIMHEKEKKQLKKEKLMASMGFTW